MAKKSLPERINSLLNDCKYGRINNVDGSNAMIPLLQESLEQAKQLQADNKLLETERNILAMLASDKPKFFNPFGIIEAKKLRDRVIGGK